MYVTYEWAFALGSRLDVLPILYAPVSSEQMHARLHTIQYLDFANHANIPWDKLIQRLKEIEKRHKPPVVISEQELQDWITRLEGDNLEVCKNALQNLALLDHPLA